MRQRRLAHLIVGDARLCLRTMLYSPFFIALSPTTSSAAATQWLSGEVEVLGDVC